MEPVQFVEQLKAVASPNAFNPYSDHCCIYDVEGAAEIRSNMLLSLLRVAVTRSVDSIWIGQELGYRSGRRTGLAFTDDEHLKAHVGRWELPDDRPTTGGIRKERSAGAIWGVLGQISENVFLWNVFPLHSHDPGDPFSNRKHNASERRIGEGFLAELICMLQPNRLVAIGRKAQKSAHRVSCGHHVDDVRHPSRGQSEFGRQIREIYELGEGM